MDYAGSRMKDNPAATYMDPLTEDQRNEGISLDASVDIYAVWKKMVHHQPSMAWYH